MNDKCRWEDPETGQSEMRRHSFIQLQGCPLQTPMDLKPGGINMMFPKLKIKACLNCGIVEGYVFKKGEN